MELPALTARMREHLERAVKEKTQPQLQAAGDAQTWQDGRMWQFVMEVLYVAGTRACFRRWRPCACSFSGLLQDTCAAARPLVVGLQHR
jgi:hypothetical protein